MKKDNVDKYLNMSHGLELKPDVNEGFRTGENGILLYVEYLRLKALNEGLNKYDHEYFYQITKGLRSVNEGKIIHGLYDRGAGESNIDHENYVMPTKRRKISHDNLTAIAFMSYWLGTTQHKEIYEYGKSNRFCYDNTFSGEPFKGQVQIRDVIMYSVLGGSKLAKLLIPIVGIANIITCLRPKGETSGKLLHFVRSGCYKGSLVLNGFNGVCEWLLKRQYGKNHWTKIFAIYFKDENHPINVQARALK